MTIAAESPESILQRTRAAYLALQTYADSGVVVNEYGASSADTHTFSTSFKRSPRRFVFDFHKQGGDRMVIWGDPDAFHAWWKSTGAVTDYPNPSNSPAINMNGYPTSGVITKIPALLYGKDALQGVFTNFVNVSFDGTESINQRPCFRLAGKASDLYGSGREVNVRRLTIWIDTESYLVRRVREEWKPLPGQRSNVIVSFESRANPSLDEADLNFSPPE